jgi:hypothetical protein
MNAEYKPTPEEESAQRRADNDREGQKDIDAALAACELARSKSAGQVGSLGVVGGSFPVPSAELLEWLRSRIALCEADEREARDACRYNNALHARSVADAYWNVVGFIQRRTDAARATERQPEENA